MVDYKDFDRSFGSLQLEAQLLLSSRNTDGPSPSLAHSSLIEFTWDTCSVEDWMVEIER